MLCSLAGPSFDSCLCCVSCIASMPIRFLFLHSQSSCLFPATLSGLTLSDAMSSSSHVFELFC